MRELKPWAQDDRDQFVSIFGYGGNCSCHLHPPCGSCTHPGNPYNQDENEDAWGFDLDYEVEAATDRIRRHIDREVQRHLTEMRGNHEHG